MKPREFPKRVEKDFSLKLNRNQTLQIERLIYEITRTRGLSFPEVRDTVKQELGDKNPQGKDRFHHIKRILVDLRYPLSA